MKTPGYATYITPEIVTAQTKCPRKAYHLLSPGDQMTQNDYLTILEAETRKARHEYLEELKHMYPNAASHLQNGFRRDNPVVLEPLLEFEDLKARPDALIPLKGISSGRPSCYAPVLVVGIHRISKDHRLRLACVGHILSKMREERPSHGFIVTREGRRHRVGLDDLYHSIIKILKTLRSQLGLQRSEAPPVFLNKECPYCAFQKDCEATARQQDHLSLLKGMSAKEIHACNRKGIFTVTQLSYTYRARRRRKGEEDGDPKYSYALKALAIRDNRIYVAKKAIVPLCRVRLYLDVEGIPDRSFYYLVGLSVAEEGRPLQHLSHWADTQCDEESIWRAFLSAIRPYDEFTLFHYGGYEAAFINNMSKRYYRKRDAVVLKHLKANSINTLSLIYSKYYFPTYTNGLKDIASYLGHRWTEECATGLTSLAWRHMWEMTGQKHLKAKLIQYNWEDCLALKCVTEAVIASPGPPADGHPESEMPTEGLRYMGVPKTEAQYSHQFCEFKSPIAHLEEINRYAYFDYQRSRVYLKTNKRLRRLAKRHSKRTVHRANKTIHIPLLKRCRHCGHTDVRKHSRFGHTNIDLRFMRSGVKRWVTHYVGSRSLCCQCGRTAKPKGGKGIKRYGEGLAIWTADLFVSHGINLNTIKNSNSSAPYAW